MHKSAVEKMCFMLPLGWIFLPNAETPLPTSRPASAFGYKLAVLFGLAVTLASRNPWMVTTPQLWNEDLWVFLRDQRERGGLAIFHPYAGYLHLMPRIVAALAGALPLYFIPWCYAAGSLAGWLWVGWRILGSPLFTHPARAAIAVLAIGLMPQNGEVVLILTNVQWILAVGLAVLLAEPTHPPYRAHDLVFAAGAALTGPFSFLLLPLSVHRMWQTWRSSGRIDPIALVAIGGAVIQGACVALFSNRLDSTTSVTPMALVSALVKGPAGFFAIPRLTPGHPVTWVFGFACVLAGCLLAVSGRWLGAAARRRLLIAAALILIPGVAVSLSAHAVQPSVQGDSGRYLFVPGALFMISMILVWQSMSPRSAWRVMPVMLLALALACSARKFRAPRYPVPDWAGICREVDAGRTVNVQTWPGWNRTVELRPITR